MNSYGEIDVFFNRPISLLTNTCYTIETETDTTGNDHLFVWAVSLQDRKSSFFANKASIISNHCSGLYTECIPTHVHYKGEIMELLYKNI